jgi:ribose transport system substrate-binding protein
MPVKGKSLASCCAQEGIGGKRAMLLPGGKILKEGEKMKLSNRWFLAAVCLFSIVLLSSCSTPKDEGVGTAKKFKVAFITNNASDFWTIARRGCEKADAELDNVVVDFKIPGEGSAAEQKRIIDDLLAKGIDGMAISPVDPTNQTQLINETAKKALVLTQDSDAPNSERACYIGTDNRAAGRQAGQLIKEALPNGGKIMIFVGKLDAQNAQERYQGIKEALAGSKVEILDVRTDDTDRVRARANVNDTMVKHPDIAALVGLWSYNGPSILNAVREANKIGQIKIVCFDEEEQTLSGVKDGSIYATVVQQPFEFGYQAITLMEKALRGDKSTIPEAKQLFVPTLIIKKENVGEFTEKLNSLKAR